MLLLDGKKLSTIIKEELKKNISKHQQKPTLAVVLVGNDEASKIYVKNKIKSCEECGIKSIAYKYDDMSEDELLELIKKLNEDKNINGILVQLPLPKHIDKDKIIKAISADKDVDGFCGENIAGMFLDKECLKSCTPKGIIRLLKHHKIPIKGQNVVIVGASNIVGKPLSLLMINESATVTVCRSSTKDISLYTKTADIVIMAAGKANLLKKDMVKNGAVIVDVGMNRLDEKLVGDVDFDSVSSIASAITPVPGGVGPMTIASLLENTYQAFLKQNNLR